MTTCLADSRPATSAHRTLLSSCSTSPSTASRSRASSCCTLLLLDALAAAAWVDGAADDPTGGNKQQPSVTYGIVENKNIMHLREVAVDVQTV